MLMRHVGRLLFSTTVVVCRSAWCESSCRRRWEEPFRVWRSTGICVSLTAKPLKRLKLQRMSENNVELHRKPSARVLARATRVRISWKVIEFGIDGGRHLCDENCFCAETAAQLNDRQVLFEHAFLVFPRGYPSRVDQYAKNPVCPWCRWDFRAAHSVVFCARVCQYSHLDQPSRPRFKRKQKLNQRSTRSSLPRRWPLGQPWRSLWSRTAP